MDGTGKVDKDRQMTMESDKRVVIYTQRVEVVESYGERRDCADQNIPLLLQECGYIPVPIPNVVESLETFVNILHPAGILLTGGNSLVRYGGTAPERDETDVALIRLAQERGIPIYGFCRGMQSILVYFGCELQAIEGHVAVRHTVNGEWGELEVNSYHNQACVRVKPPLHVMALSADGVVEAVACRERRIMAAMWHPEREKPFVNSDIVRIKTLFG